MSGAKHNSDRLAHSHLCVCVCVFSCQPCVRLRSMCWCVRNVLCCECVCSVCSVCAGDTFVLCTSALRALRAITLCDASEALARAMCCDCVRVCVCCVLIVRAVCVQACVMCAVSYCAYFSINPLTQTLREIVERSLCVFLDTQTSFLRLPPSCLRVVKSD